MVTHKKQLRSNALSYKRAEPAETHCVAYHNLIIRLANEGYQISSGNNLLDVGRVLGEDGSNDTTSNCFCVDSV